VIAAWMVYSTLVAFFFLVAVVALEKGLRLARRPGRWVIAAAMAVSAALPFFTRAEPAGMGVAAGGGGLLTTNGSLAPLVEMLPRSSALASLDIPLVVFWIGASTTLLAIVALTHLRVARKIRGYPTQMVNEATVLRSPALGPAVVGVLKSSIVLPKWVDKVGPDWRRLMVLHEQEHLRGRDGSLLSAAVLLTIAMPWNVPMWCLLFRLRRAIELDCDQRVLRSGVDVRQYGNLLLEVSRRRVRSPLPVMGLAFNRSFLAQRVDAMTLHLGRFKYPRAMAAVLVGGAFVAVACELPAPLAPGMDGGIETQETANDVQDIATVYELASDEDSAITYAIRRHPEGLRTSVRALDLYVVANDSTMVRVPKGIAQRVQSDRMLLTVTEERGEPVVLLRTLPENESGSTTQTPISRPNANR